MQALHIGLGLYLANIVVGLLAKFARVRFGAFHHVFYAIVFAGALAATVLDFHVALLITLSALAALPFISAKSRMHPALAVVGLGGYVLTFALR